MHRHAVAAALIAVETLVIGQLTDAKLTPPPSDLSGYYAVEGAETGGKKYSGVVVIDRKNEVYLCQWTVGGSTFVGVGLHIGDTLSVGWANEKGVRGCNVYKVAVKKLTGRWASIPGNGQIQSEVLTFLKALPVED